MREADHHVDRIGPGFHDLHDRASGALQQPARGRRLVDARDDQRGRPLAEEHFQQALLLHAGIMRVADLDLEVGVAQAVIDAAHHVGKDVVGQRRDQHADHVGARRGQRPRIGVGNVAERLDCRRDLPAQIFGHAAPARAAPATR